MSVGPLGALSSAIGGMTNSAQTQSSGASSGSAGTSFAQMLSNAVGQANTLANEADSTAAAYAAGEPVSVNQLMTVEQEASLAVDLVVQTRDRVVSAYQSIMNMQI